MLHKRQLTGLFHLSIAQLTQLRGIGTVKAVQLHCIGELTQAYQPSKVQ